MPGWSRKRKPGGDGKGSQAGASHIQPEWPPGAEEVKVPVDLEPCDSEGQVGGTPGWVSNYFTGKG